MKFENDNLIKNKNLKQNLIVEQNKNKWYKDFTQLENRRFEDRFEDILSHLFSPTQIRTILHPKKKIYRWKPEDISSAISLSS